MSADVHNPTVAVTDWQAALELLKSGNKRFRENKMLPRNVTDADRKALENGQKPFAAIISCSDSRLPPEVIFDQSIGNIFVLRNAGNTLDTSMLGTIEFAVEYLKAPLVVVMGHSYCAAVITAFKGAGEFKGNLQSLLMDNIRPSVKDCSDDNDAIRANTKHVVGELEKNDAVKRSGAKVVGAFYDIVTGEVTF